MLSRRTLFAAVLVATLPLGCPGRDDVQAQPPPPDQPAPPGTSVRSSLAFNEAPAVDPALLAALTAGQVALGAELLAQGDGNENQALSPVSMSVAFAMLSAGARGHTLAELEGAMRFLPQTDLHLAMNALNAAFMNRDVPTSESQDGLVLRPVNQVFQQDGFDVESAFLDTLAERYNAGVRLMDFSGNPETARVDINAWVEAQTNERIQDLLPVGSITDLTRLVLANALYLKAAWKMGFAEDATRDRTFHTPSGDVETAFVHGEVDHEKYARIGDVDVLELPFVGDAIVMDFIIGRNGASVDLVAIASQLDALQPAGHHLQVPKFRVKVPFDLKAGLSALGVNDLFLAGVCDLTGLQPDANLYVSGAFHQTFVELNEKGVEAAAATAIVTNDASAPETLALDEPFYFLIRDTATGAPLFLGHIVDPSQEG